MSKIDKRIEELGNALPPPVPVPDATKDYMAMVQIVGDRHPAPQEVNLFDMQTKYSEVVRKAEIIRLIEQLGK